MADFDVTKPMNEAEMKEAVQYYINMLETAQKEYYDEILRLSKEKQTDKIIGLLKIDEFVDLADKNPELVAGVINAFGNRPVGISILPSLYSLSLEAISKREAKKNFKLAEYVDLAAYIGQEGDIRNLSKEERYTFNRLFEKYERVQANRGLKGDSCAWYFLDELLDRGDLLNCKDLTPEQRAVVMDKYLNPRNRDKFKNRLNLLKRLDEKYISQALVENVLRGPAGFFEKELGTPWLQLTDKRGEKTAEYQKFEKAAMRVIEKMPRYDQNSSFGREVGLNERFDMLLKKTHYDVFRNLNPRDINVVVKNLYLKTAEQDIINGNADKLSYHALAYVLQNDKQGYYARKISPEVYKAAQKQARLAGREDLFKPLKTAEFLIYRNQVKTAEEMGNVVRSDVFLKLSPKEREEMITISMLTEFAKLVHLSENEQKEIADALRLVNEGKTEEMMPKSSKTAEELIEDVLQAYGAQKDHALRRTENAQKIEMIIRDHQHKADAYERAFQTLENLQQAYHAIGEQSVSEQAAEDVISKVVQGQKHELKMPDFGRLPLFGREKERQRRANVERAVKAFNGMLFSLSNDSEVREVLKEHKDYLAEKGNEDLRSKGIKEIEALTYIKVHAKGYNTGAFWPEDIDDRLEKLIREHWLEDYETKPLRPVNGLEALYKFIEDSLYIESKFKTADTEYGSYLEALKAVAHERVGVDEAKTSLVPVVKAQGRKTAQERAENAKRNIDKLGERQKKENNVNEAKAQIFKAKETIKKQKTLSPMNTGR